MFQEGYYEELGYDLFYKLDDYRQKYKSLASISQISLLMGLISDYKFSNGRKIEKVLEVGVYNGVTSLCMLKTGCNSSKNYKLYGIDIDPSDFCGEAVIKEANKTELNSYSLHRGKTVLNISEILDKDEKLDLVFLDGGHSHPFPLINLVCVIPYLHKESLICLHDVKDYMQPNDWGESFVYEIWPEPKYRDTDPLGNKGTLGVVQLPENKDVLSKMLLKLAKIPFRASQYKYNGEYLGVDESTFAKLKSFMIEHYDLTFTEEFIGHLCNNLKNYNEEYILRIHETRFYKYLYEEIKNLKNNITDLKQKIVTLNYENQNLLGNNNLLKLLNSNPNKKVLIWGASLYLESFLKTNNLSNYNIVGIVDINAKRKGQIGGYKLYTPKEITEIDADLIISTVLNSNEKVYEEIKQYLIKNEIKIELAPNIFTE